MRKNNLDEMQEQKLLKIEHNGMWFAFWGLLIAILVQICMGADFKQFIGEWLIFMILCIYTSIGCIKNGIWDRSLKPNVKTNILLSLIAALVVCVTFGFAWHGSQPIMHVALGGIILGVFVFTACFIALEASCSIYKKRREKLDEETKTSEE